MKEFEVTLERRVCMVEAATLCLPARSLKEAKLKAEKLAEDFEKGQKGSLVWEAVDSREEGIEVAHVEEKE